jgi:tyrosyl-tRNA synthetase
VVRFVHGEDARLGASLATDTLFGSTTLDSLTSKEQTLLKAEAPIKTITNSPLIDLLIETELATSKREARQFISEGAIALNDTILTDEMVILSEQISDIAILRRGKKNRIFIGK